jgi:hypothetical protein
MKTTQAIKTTLFAATLALGASTVFAQSTNTTPTGSPNPTMKSLEHSQGNQNPATPMTGQAGAKPAAGAATSGSTSGNMSHTGSSTHSGTMQNKSTTTRGAGDASPSSETRGVPDSESKSTPIPSAQPGKR